MYDNIDLTVNKESCPNTDFLDIIPNLLTDVTNKGVNRFGAYVNGYLDNLKVSISETRVKISESSICKYYLGDNFKTLSRGDTKRAIEKISDNLHLPFNLANVSRIDFAQNLLMKHNEKIYYPYLGEAQYYSRLEQNNGLYYNNQKRQLVFYGKEYEQKLKRQPIPEIYRNRNVLRFEMRFKRNLKDQLKRSEIKAGILSDEEFYKGLLKRWRNEYLAIQKINSKLINMKPTGSKKEFIESLAIFTIKDLGQPQILNMVKEWRETGEITKKQAYDLRASIKELNRIPVEGKGNDFIAELDRKIKEAARDY